MATRRGRPPVLGKSLGAVARTARQHFGLTQKEAAALVGVHPQTISDWERGHLALSKAQLDQVQSAYARTVSAPKPPDAVAGLSVVATNSATRFDDLCREFQEVYDWWARELKRGDPIPDLATERHLQDMLAREADLIALVARQSLREVGGAEIVAGLTESWPRFRRLATKRWGAVDARGVPRVAAHAR